MAGEGGFDFANIIINPISTIRTRRVATEPGPTLAKRVFDKMLLAAPALQGGFERPDMPKSLDAGWWEALVVTINPGILALRWRDYPKLAAINRGTTQIGFFAAEK